MAGTDNGDLYIFTSSFKLCAHLFNSGQHLSRVSGLKDDGIAALVDNTMYTISNILPTNEAGTSSLTFNGPLPLSVPVFFHMTSEEKPALVIGRSFLTPRTCGALTFPTKNNTCSYGNARPVEEP